MGRKHWGKMEVAVEKKKRGGNQGNHNSEEKVKEMITGDEDWRRWQQKNKIPFVSLLMRSIS